MKIDEVELYVCNECQDVQLEHPEKCPECGGEISCVDFVPRGGELGCTSKDCDYYSHYLYYYNPEVNGLKLEHNAFHLAVERCSKAQDEIMKWMQDHEGIDPLDDPTGKFLWEKAAKLELRVAA